MKESEVLSGGKKCRKDGASEQITHLGWGLEVLIKT